MHRQAETCRPTGWPSVTSRHGIRHAAPDPRCALEHLDGRLPPADMARITMEKSLHVHASCCMSLPNQQDLFRQAMAGCCIIRPRITDTTSYGIASVHGRLHGEYARIRRIRPVAQVMGRCRVGGLQRHRQAVRRAPQRLKLLYRQRDAFLPW